MKNINDKISHIKSKIKTSLTLFAFLGAFALNVNADAPVKTDVKQALSTLQHQWVQANYEEDDKVKEVAFIALQDSSTLLTAVFPEQAQIWIWHGIIQSSYAGVKGGLSALSLVDDAKDSFEKALTLDENALQGSAHTSLGILYLKVPGWPISFGDDDESKKHLKMALEINPTGIDVNYFLAEFYVEQRNYLKAKEHLIAAQSAPARLNRADADKFRQLEVSTLLIQVNKKLIKG